MEMTNEKNIATFTHLSVLGQYIIPFSNYVLPVVLWSSYKERSTYEDHHGKQVINFQLSILLYTLVAILVAIPIFIITFLQNIPLTAIFNDSSFDFDSINLNFDFGLLTFGILALVFIAMLKIAEFFIVIYGAIKASNGELYKYPLTIPFIK